MADRQEAKAERERVKAEYVAAKDGLLIEDLLKVLDAHYTEAYLKAGSELDNASKAQAYLQRANAYDKVRMYIREMTS